jgi:hypothetical protein
VTAIHVPIQGEGRSVAEARSEESTSRSARLQQQLLYRHDGKSETGEDAFPLTWLDGRTDAESVGFSSYDGLTRCCARFPR